MLSFVTLCDSNFMPNGTGKRKCCVEKDLNLWFNVSTPDGFLQKGNTSTVKDEMLKM